MSIELYRATTAWLTANDPILADGQPGLEYTVTWPTTPPKMKLGDGVHRWSALPYFTTGGGGGSVATDTIWDTKGDLAVATGADAAAVLPIGTSGQVLTVASGTAAWATPGGGTLPDPVTPAHGGTGATSLTAHGVLVGEGTSTVAVTAAMTDGQVLVGQSGADPLPKTVSGDATVAASGALTIASGAVTSTKIADGTIVDADVNASAAIAATKVAGTAVTQADTGTVTSAMIADATIVNADVSTSAAIAATKISGTAVTQADTGTVSSTMIADGTIVNADISASAAIAASKISGTAATHAENLSVFAATTSAQLAGVISDETGSGALVFGTSPSLASPALTGSPTAPTQSPGDSSTLIATDAFVAAAINAAISGLSAKTDVAYVAVAALPACTYANGSSGVGATLTGNANGPLLIDGVTIVTGQAGERVLITAQASAFQNGWYTITQIGIVAVSPYILTRATDSDQAAEIGAGYLTSVVAPNAVVAGTNNGTVWISVAADPFTVGTTTVSFSQVGGVYAAGTGLSLSGQTFSIDTSVVARKSDNLSVFAATTSAQLAGVLSDETGSGAAVFATSPTLVTPALGTPSALVLTNATGLPEAGVTNLTTDLAGKQTLRTRATPVTASTVTVSANQITPFDVTSNACTATLPAANSVPAGTPCVLKIILPVATGLMTNAVTYQCAGSDKINRSTSTPGTSGTLTIFGQAVWLESDGTSIWTVVSDDLPYSVLQTINDARYASSVGVGLLTKVLGGMTVPTSSLDRWKAGRSMPATRLNGAINNSATGIVVQHNAITPTTMHRRLTIESEEVFTTAGEGTTTAITGVTSVATTGIFTKTAHGLQAGQIVVPAANVLDSFLTIGTTYYVSATNFAANTFSVATTVNGSVLTGTTNDTNLTLTAYGMLTLTTRGTVNGTAAVSHADKAPIYSPRYKTVVHLGDSVVEGTDLLPELNDSWTIRAARMTGDRMGGLIGASWPMWRSTTTGGPDQEYVLTGAAGNATNAAYDLGWQGAVVFTGGASNGIVWTRPAGVRIQAVDIMWVDYSASGGLPSYSIDGAATWVNVPAQIFSSGKGLLRRVRVACNDPTDIRVRAANAAGTNQTIVLPYVPLTTWTTMPYPGVTDGLHWANLGQAGVKLRTILNARVVTDAVTDGSGGITSATAAFVANDVNSFIFVAGVATTLSARTNGTTATTAASLAAGSGQRLTILQGSGTGDWMANFLNQHGSWFPDLVIIGPYENDIINGGTNGDGNFDFYGDMLQFLYTQISPVADIMFVAPHESGTQPSGIQTSYRTTMHTIAANNNAAILDLYDAFSADGYTGYTAVNGAGYMHDTVHFNYKGNNWMGNKLARILGMI